MPELGRDDRDEGDAREELDQHVSDTAAITPAADLDPDGVGHEDVGPEAGTESAEPELEAEPTPVAEAAPKPKRKTTAAPRKRTTKPKA
jgi:hypothetical protein